MDSFWENKKRQQLVGRIIAYILLVAGSIVFMIPFVWLLSSSFKGNMEIFEQPVHWIPKTFRWSNYKEAITSVPFFTFLGNTLKITILGIVGNVFMSALTAFAFARLRARGSGILFGLLLATMMLPGQVTMIPTFVMFSEIGWSNTHLPLIIPAFFGGSAYHIFLMRQFFSGIPKSLDDAARIDGVTNFGLFWRIILPSSVPVLLTVAVFTFTSRWNDFMGPLIYLNSMDKYTLSLGLNLFKNQYTNQWNLTMAYNVLTILPVVIIFFIAQKYFIQGIVITGEKG